MKALDLTGVRFGRLTAVCRVENPKYKGTSWLCKCDCGGEKIAPTQDLRSGKIQSCGCIKAEISQKAEDKIVNQKFGRLTVLSVDHREAKRMYLKCKCDCGNETIVRKDQLVNGHTTSCGCAQKDAVRALAKHGMCETRVYKLYQTMKARCYSPKANGYEHYGGRGIKVCDEWLNDPMTFIKWCYDNGYDDTAERGECTIDRIDVNGDYEPSNCRFVPNLVQQNNRRNTIYWEYEGEKHPLADWSRITGISYDVLFDGYQRGLGIEYYLTKYQRFKHYKK